MRKWAAALSILSLPLWSAPPRTMLWSWERPDDLRFLDSPDTGVAFLAGSVLLRGGETLTRYRRQPLRTLPQTPLMAVIRIETDARQRPSLSTAQVASTARFVQEIAATSHVSAVQIDFDARLSERTFYRGLLQQVRRDLGTSVFLSITALVSWCETGKWLASLPVDEAVPMLFRMGPQGRPVFYALVHGGDLPAQACRTSLGVSLDEDLPPLQPGRRQYWFDPRPWTAAAVRSVRAGETYHP